MTLSALGIFSAAGAGGVVGGTDYELISSTILGSAQSSVVFDVSSFSTSYKHLQVRWVARSSSAEQITGFYSRLNGDTGSNYSLHTLFGNGSGVFSGNATSTTVAITGIQPGANAPANTFAAGVIDLLDPFSTTKNKTFRTLSGAAMTDNRIDLHSGNWRNTAAVTSWTVFPQAGNFVTGSRLSIYGIKG